MEDVEESLCKILTITCRTLIDTEYIKNSKHALNILPILIGLLSKSSCRTQRKICRILRIFLPPFKPYII